MITITLPDGSQRQFENPVTIAQVAEDIGPGLAKAALAGQIDGQMLDTSHLIEQDAGLSIITSRDEAGLEVIRHSTAHLMAQAVKRLYPEVQVTIGPVIDNGFYYDYAWPDGFNTEDLEKIEQEMKRIVKEALVVNREVMDRDEAIAYFADMGEAYKAEIIRDLPEGEQISLYRQGDFVDLCRGPHVPNTGKLGSFKLTSVAGAFWRGDSNNEMLQRIYGTAWANKQDLKAHLERLEEAAKRDHRKLGTQLDLFHLQPEAPGMVFWHPNGWQIWLEVEQYIRNKLTQNGYQEIRTPQVVDIELWKKSGHTDKFADGMFLTESESREYAIKPMNCPCHVQVFNKNLHSYRDLPLRLAEFGSCHRNEPSGALHGIMRVRGFTQDDAHIFCTPEQIVSEAADFIDLVYEVYRDFGFEDVIVKLSTRPEKRIGSDEMWDEAEKALADALNDKGIDWEEQPGEGAFYGPKIEFSLRDCLDRVWQCGTLQMDPFLPERLNASYIDANGEKQRPMMLHRAIVGSMERFIGVLIEHHAGIMPLWLSPIQVKILNITDDQREYCQSLQKSLSEQGFRVDLDLRNEKIGYKIREATLKKTPYLLVIGNREMEQGTVAVRLRDGTDLGAMSLEALSERLADEIRERKQAS